jgi:ABC-2 type transport system ATP-binding protein
VGDTAILAEGLERRFGANHAVAGVDLAITPGEIYGFLGPNGAGKSTTMRMLVTLLAPSGGRAVVAGHDVAREPEAVRLRIGVALQEAALDDSQTGRELLRLQGRLYGLRGHELDQQVRTLEGLIDIGPALDQRVGTYSGGMKRRLDLVCALVHNPEVLFLDEPTTGLDPISRARVWEEVRHLNETLGMTIFLTTQYLDEADALAGRVGIIDRGRIVAEGSPEELKRSIGDDVVTVEVDGPAEDAARLVKGVAEVHSVGVVEQELTIRTADGATAISPIAVTLAEGGVKVRTLSLRTPTLDDVFLELTGGHLHEEERA